MLFGNNEKKIKIGCRLFNLIILSTLLMFTVSCVLKHGSIPIVEAKKNLKTPLIKGERLIKANSCSKVAKASFMMGGVRPVFGSIYLTNLRIIFEESEWVKALDTASRLVPTSGDFGIREALSGAKTVFDAYFIVNIGVKGSLEVVKKDGRIFIPLAQITDLKVTGSRFKTESIEGQRFLTIKTKDDIDLIFEIYNLPPDKTGILPDFLNHHWREEIQKGIRSLELIRVSSKSISYRQFFKFDKRAER